MEPENRCAEIECENCGEPVLVILPFTGCVLCRDCSEYKPYSWVGTEQFTPKYFSRSKEGGDGK